MPNSALGKQRREVLALFNAGGSDQNRLTLRVTIHDVFNHHVELDLFVFINQVGLVDSNHWLVGWDWNYAEFVGAHKLGGLGCRGSGHTGKLGVETEVVLQSHGGQGLVFGFDLNAFFGFDGLVNSLVIATTLKDTSGVLVND